MIDREGNAPSIPSPGPPSGNIRDSPAYRRLNALISKGAFHVEISKFYSMDKATQADRDAEKHPIGKLTFEVRRA